MVKLRAAVPQCCEAGLSRAVDGRTTTHQVFLTLKSRSLLMASAYRFKAKSL